MEFLFLGTGPAESIPRFGHKDPLCLDARRPRSKSRRLRSAGLLTHGRTSVLFDAGPDVAYQLATHRIQHLDAVFLTHAHLDAAGGLKALDAWARKRGLVMPVFTEPATVRRYGVFDSLDYRMLKSGGTAKVGQVSVRCFRVRHSLSPGFPTLGFRVGKFAYASDVAAVPSASLKLLKGVEAAALDSAFWFGRPFRGHLTPDRAVRYAQWIGAKRLLLTQIGHTYPPHEDAEVSLRVFVMARAPGLEAALAHDGLRLKL